MNMGGGVDSTGSQPAFAPHGREVTAMPGGDVLMDDPADHVVDGLTRMLADIDAAWREAVLRRSARHRPSAVIAGSALNSSCESR
ncbi:hypothetical protein [Longispora urticae]